MISVRVKDGFIDGLDKRRKYEDTASVRLANAHGWCYGAPVYLLDKITYDLGPKHPITGRHYKLKALDAYDIPDSPTRIECTLLKCTYGGVEWARLGGLYTIAITQFILVYFNSNRATLRTYKSKRPLHILHATQRKDQVLHTITRRSDGLSMHTRFNHVLH